MKFYNENLKERLDNMERSDKAFWQLTKEIAGQSRSANKAAPSPDELANHFAEKMSNAKDAKGSNWRPRDGETTTFNHFKVNLAKVLKSPKGLAWVYRAHALHPNHISLGYPRHSSATSW